MFDLAGTEVATVGLGRINGDGALSPPFVGPDGRMWFGQGSFGQGASGIVAVDAAYKIEPVAACGGCFFAGGIVAADGNAWLLDPYLSGFYRVATQGTIMRFDYGKVVVQTLIAGPQSALWGVASGNIAEYGLTGTLLATYVPKVAVQSGLRLERTLT